MPCPLLILLIYPSVSLGEYEKCYQKLTALVMLWLKAGWRGIPEKNGRRIVLSNLQKFCLRQVYNKVELAHLVVFSVRSTWEGWQDSESQPAGSSLIATPRNIRPANYNGKVNKNKNKTQKKTKKLYNHIHNGLEKSWPGIILVLQHSFHRTLLERRK